MSPALPRPAGPGRPGWAGWVAGLAQTAVAVVARRRRLAAVVVVVCLVVGSTGAGAWWWYRTADPLAGELEALEGDPQAALDWLVPQDGGTTAAGGGVEVWGSWEPSAAAVSRWEELSRRRWGSRGVEALGRVLASVVALRGPGGEGARQPGHDSQPDPGGDAGGGGVEQARATWAVAQGLVVLADHASLLDEQGRQAVGALLAGCGPEVVSLARATGVLVGEGDPYQGVPAITTGGGDEEVLENAVARLVYEAAGSGRAVLNIARGTTVYTTQRANARAAAEPDIPLIAVEAVYILQVDLVGLLVALGGQEAVSWAWAGVVSAAGVLAARPGGGVEVVTTATASGSTPGGASLDEEAVAALVEDHQDASALWGPALLNLVGAGVPVSLPGPGTVTWHTVDEQGRHHLLLDEPAQAAGLHDWVAQGAGDSPQVVETLTGIVPGPRYEPRWGSAERFKEKYGEDW